MTTPKVAGILAAAAIGEAAVTAAGIPAWFVQLAGGLLFAFAMWSARRNIDAAEAAVTVLRAEVRTLADKLNHHGERLAALEARTAPRSAP